MASVDERIVEMTFKGEQFVANIRGTVNSLNQLKQGLNSLKGSEKDINNLDDAGKRFSLSHIGSGIDAIVGKFKALSVVGVAALATLASMAVQTGLRLLKSLTIDPIKAGLDVYETKINAIQTILANTARAGTTLKQVTDALNQLNTYANKTVYNFGQMAKNIGTFTAAGVGLKTSVASIKGIANLAALSGSSAEQASTAMYQLSQAIAAGRVKLQDWNSVVNAGIGGKVFQKALIDTARVHGVAIDEMIKKDGSFRESLQEGWITSRILTDTLAQFTGDLSLAQIKAMGYTDKEAQAIYKQGQVAVRSATQIRTITQLTQALKEEVATAWAGVWEAVIGNSVTATATLSAFHTVAENALTGPVNRLAEVFRTFDKLGGRSIVINTIKDAFHSLGEVLHTVGDAFREVFPPSGGGAAQGLLKLALSVQKFVKALEPSKATLADLKTIFTGVFSVVKIVIDVVQGFVHVLGTLFGAASSGGGGFLHLVANIASFVTKIKDAIESGNALAQFFRILATVLAIPIHAIAAVINALGGMDGAFAHVLTAIQPFVDKIRQLFSGLADAVVSGIQSGNFSQVASILNKLLLGGVLLSIRKFIKGLGQGTGGGGLFSSIKESFEALTGALKTMQASLKAGILQRIAIAVALLAASMVALSLIDVKNLVKSLSAMTVMFTQLLAAMAVITKIGGAGGIVQMEAVVIALNLLATAMILLSGAVAILAQFSWEQLAKGLSAIAILLTEVTIATSFMSKNAPGIIASAYAMEVMAVALNILSFAVKRLGELDLGTLAKGIGSIGVLLVLLGAFNAFGGEALIGTAAALVLVGVALTIIAQAVTTLGALPIGALAKGIGGIAAALLVIAVAMAVMPPDMILIGAGLIVVATALVILAQALQSMGGMSWSEIAKGLVVLAASLTILALAMAGMTEGLPGAAALLVMAAALAILTPVLIALGQMSWEAIAKGLVTLVGVFVILAAAGILLTPLIPTLLGLGLAIALFGIGLAAAGAGVFLFATGLTALAVAVTASGAAILSFVKSIITIIPTVFKALGQGIVELAKALGNGAAAIEKALAQILTAIFNGIIKVAPKAAQAFTAVIKAMTTAISKNAGPLLNTFTNLIITLINKATAFLPRFLNAGTRFIVAMLNGIAQRIHSVAQAAGNVVVAFINAVGSQLGRIVAAGVRMVIAFVNGVANRIRASGPAIQAAARNLGSAIVQGAIAGIVGGIGGVISAAVNMAKSALSAALGFLHSNSPSKVFRDQVGSSIPEGTAVGIKASTPLVTKAVRDQGQLMLDTLKNTLADTSKIIGDSLDLQPKIVPVLDLTQAKKGFDDLDALNADKFASVSLSAAGSISASQAAAAQEAAAAAGGAGTNISFVQNNNSPKALSSADIYRQTRNQLSTVKGALTKRANSS